MIPEIIKTELVVRSIYYIRLISVLFGHRTKVPKRFIRIVPVIRIEHHRFLFRLYGGRRETKKVVNRSHPLCIPACEIIIDGHDMNRVALKSVQVRGHGRHKGLSLSRLHFSDTTLMKNNAPQDLHIIRSHTDRSCGRLPHHGERLGKQIIQLLAFAQTLTKFRRLLAQRSVGKRLDFLLE